MDRRTSTIWQHYTVIDQLNNISKCDIYLKRYSFKSTMTNLKKHLSSRHGIDLSINSSKNRYASEQTGDPAPVASSSSAISPWIPTEFTPMPDVSMQSSISYSSNAFSLMQTSNSTVHKRKQTSISNYLPKKISIDAKKKLDQILLKLFIKDFQPFKVVEDSGFKEFVKALNPGYELPNRNTISKIHMPAMYEKCLGEMKELVSTIEDARTSRFQIIPYFV